MGFYYVMKKCHMCLGTDLEKFLDLGMHPHSDSFLTAGETEQPEVFYPLSVYLCRGCGLVQIGYVVDGSTLYQKNYIYYVLLWVPQIVWLYFFISYFELIFFLVFDPMAIFYLLKLG